MTEMEIQQRMTTIINEYSQLKQFDHCDLTLEAMDNQGNVKVTIVSVNRPQDKAERIIAPTESLEFITDTFCYPNTYSVRSKDIALTGLKIAYFDHWGDLIVERDDTTEKFKVKPINKQAVIDKLTKRLGDKFKKELRITEPTPPPTAENH